MTTTATRKPAATKTAIIISRYEFKCDTRKVVYLVRSSDGSTTYQTCLFAGKATSCDCPARKPCKHMVMCESHETERTAAHTDEQSREQARATRLSQAAESSRPYLAGIEAEVVADLASASSRTATATRERSEQARIADIESATVYANRLTAELALQQAEDLIAEEQDPHRGMTREERRAAYGEFEYFYETF